MHARAIKIHLRSQRSVDPPPPGSNSQVPDNGAKEDSKAAAAMKRYRAKLKEDPAAWAAHKAKERERHKIRRQNRTEQQMARDRETGARRQKKYAAKNKEGEAEMGTGKNKKKKVLTRSEKKSQQEYWRAAQQRCRANKSAQKRRRDKEKDRERHKKRRLEKKVNNPTDAGEGNPFNTKNAMHKAMSRVWSKVPKDPMKFAQICHGLIDGKKTTPRKREALRTLGINKKESCRRNLAKDLGWKNICEEVRTSINSDEARQKRRNLVSSVLIQKKYRLQRKLAAELGVRPNYLSKVNTSGQTPDGRYRKRRSDATCMDVLHNVTDFYCSAEVSRELPFMRSVHDVKHKFPKQRRVMEMSIEKAHKMWQERNPNLKAHMSESLFRRLRPNHVSLLRTTRAIQCLCEYCTDVLLILRSFNKAAQVTGNAHLKLKDKYDLTEATLCPKLEGSLFHQLKCINRNCDQCGTSVLQDKLASLAEDHGNRAVSWQRWCTQNYLHNGIQKSKKVLTKKIGTVETMVEEMLDQCKPLARHLFDAMWQQAMYRQITKNLPKQWAVCVMDFAQNYACTQQDEIQSAHWAIQQVTVHPSVVFYHCECEGHNHIVQEAVVFISEDLKHDAHAVNHFRKLCIAHLREKRHLEIKKMIEFTDGCSSQYKSRLPFSDITFSKEDLGMDVERHFFGSRHGKGPSDGVSGVVKSKTRLAVISRNKVVNSAKDMFDFCSDQLVKDDCGRQRRVFYYVGTGDIERERPARAVRASLAGTRVLHAVKAVKPGVLDTRMFSCFCKACIEGTDGCQNTAYVIPWQRRALAMEQEPVATDETTDLWDHSLEDLVTNDYFPIDAPDSPLDAQGLIDYLEAEDANTPLTPAAGKEVFPATEVILIAESADAGTTVHTTGNPESGRDMNQSAKESVGIDEVEQHKYYAVYFSKTYYIGRVTAAQDEQYEVKFLHKMYRNAVAHFFLPKKPDIDTIGKDRFFYGPIEVTGTPDDFTIQDDVLSAITQRYTQLKQKLH